MLSGRPPLRFLTVWMRRVSGCSSVKADAVIANAEALLAVLVLHGLDAARADSASR